MAYICFYVRVLKVAIVPEFAASRTNDLKLGKTQSRLALWINLTTLKTALTTA